MLQNIVFVLRISASGGIGVMVILYLQERWINDVFAGQIERLEKEK